MMEMERKIIAKIIYQHLDCRVSCVVIRVLASITESWHVTDVVAFLKEV